jgi:plastocyanin
MNHLSIALRRGALITLILAFSAVVAACTGGGDETEPAGTDGGTTGGTATVENGAVDVSADNLAFDVSTIEAPAGEEFTITLTNNEAQPHNISIYTEENGEEIAVGDVITGPDATADTVVPALDPGEYYFVCDVHPEMNGTLVVEG